MWDLIGAADAQTRPRMRRHNGHIHAPELYLSLSRGRVSSDQVEQRGLAGAIGAYHRQRFTVLNGNADVIYGFERTVML